MKVLKTAVVLSVLGMLPAVLWAQPQAEFGYRPATGYHPADVSIVGFTDIGAALAAVDDASVVWGDYDDDGDLDILLTGLASGSGSIPISRVYRNDAGTFADIGAGLPGVYLGSVAWGDYDNDGDLDILLTGRTLSGRISRVYRNDAGAFTDIGAGLPEVGWGSVAWGDYDNDGDLDILLTGFEAEDISRVYRNDGGAFTDIVAGLQGAHNTSVAWGDYDNDGDLDILLTGYRQDSGFIFSRVYRNDAGAFVDVAAGLTGVMGGSAAWGDYDHDGDLDILLTGWTGSGSISRVYRNDAGAFTDIVAGLPEVSWSSVGWGDYDNDGDLDILLTGDSGPGFISRVYRNDASAFIDVVAGLPGMHFSSAAWGDYDNDGDLDILLTGGMQESPWIISRVYRSTGATANVPPVAPGGLSASVAGDLVTLSWSASSDAQTPAAGLSYNLRVGTTPGGNEISTTMANGANGHRRVVQWGNAQERTSWTVRVSPGNYHWSVQAVDGAYAGSPFAGEETFSIGPVSVSVQPPRELDLALSTANPVVGPARFRIALPTRANVKLSIYDLTGRRVAMLLEGVLEAGYHTATWGARDANPSLAAGTYFARLTTGGRALTQRIVLLH